MINEVAHPVLDSVDHPAARDESESVSVDDGRSWDEAIRAVSGSIRVNAIEVVDPVRSARPPEIVAVNRRASRLDANNRPHVVVVVISDMSHDDFRVVVGRDDRRGAGTRMIVINELIGVGSVVLLEPCAVGREGREGRPRTILGEWVFRADEAGGCDRPICHRHDRHERGYEETPEESAHHTELAQRALPFNEVHWQPHAFPARRRRGSG